MKSMPIDLVFSHAGKRKQCGYRENEPVIFIEAYYNKCDGDTYLIIYNKQEGVWEWVNINRFKPLQEEV